jgi:hypothetical protein
MLRGLRAWLATAAAAGLAAGAAALAPAAGAATPACTAVPGNACGSWNAEVPGLPDLDVAGGAAASGTAIIMFTRTATDKAEDFRVQAVSSGSVAKYTTTGAHNYTAGVTTLGVADGVRIQYAPFGVASGFCVSTVNPVGGTAVQLRWCDNTPGEFNQFQTFRSAAAVGDGTFVSFREVINDLALTDPRNGGSIGVIGHRVHVITRAYTGISGQLWGQNGA